MYLNFMQDAIEDRDLTVNMLCRQNDRMGRLIAWLISDDHDIPKVSSETKKYIVNYMQETLELRG